MEILLKCVLTGLLATCLSVSAAPEPSRLLAPTLNFAQTKSALQPPVVAPDGPVKPAVDVVPIYLYARENSLDGDYNFRYETGNGIFAEERGVMLNKGTEDEANSVVGSYRYVSPEGVPIEVTYTAGVDGFRAYGAHLPVSPPAATNLPKSLSYKNVAPSAFAQSSQLRALDETDSSVAVSTGTSQAASVAEYQTTPEVPAVVYWPTPEAPAPHKFTSEEPATNQPTSKPSVVYQPTPEAANSNQVQFAATGQMAVAGVDEIDGVASAVAAQGQTQQVLYVGGSDGGLESTEKPLLQDPVRVEQPQQLQDSFVRPEYYQGDLSAAVPAVQPQALPVEKIESALPPVLQAQSAVVPARPKVAPVLQRVMYQPQPQPQLPQQKLFGAGPAQAVDRQQPYSQTYRQFSIEPQQMWYVSPYQQQGRHLQTGPVKRTLEPLKYN
ncbi:Hypothetical protein CINCED_3A001033 [Cinara cedri]|nr:Hypothetical protein CINCED_3A001033 [Cinara cedri]